MLFPVLLKSFQPVVICIKSQGFYETDDVSGAFTSFLPDSGSGHGFCLPTGVACWIHLG
jgi:hypothetical protein